jgi:hypothetical protein
MMILPDTGRFRSCRRIFVWPNTIDFYVNVNVNSARVVMVAGADGIVTKLSSTAHRSQ